MRYAFLCLTLLAIPSMGFAQEIATPISSSQMTQAATGERLVTAERGTPNRGQVIALVDAPFDDVLAIIVDGDNHDQWFPDMVVTEVLSRTGDVARVQGQTHVPVVRNRDWQLDITHSERTFSGHDCHLLEYALADTDYGNMDDLYGYWLLCPYNSGSQAMLKYVVNADLGVWLPAAIVNWATRRMLPGIPDGLEERYAELN